MCWSPPVSPGSSGSKIIKLNQPGKWKPAWWFAKTSTPLWGRLIYCFFPQHGTLKHIPFNSESRNVQLPSWNSLVKRPWIQTSNLENRSETYNPDFAKCILMHILISLIIEHGIACSCIWFLYMSFPEHQEPEDPDDWRWVWVKMAPRMAAVLRAPGKLCSFFVCFICFFVVLRVRCC